MRFYIKKSKHFNYRWVLIAERNSVKRICGLAKTYEDAKRQFKLRNDTADDYIQYMDITNTRLTPWFEDYSGWNGYL